MAEDQPPEIVIVRRHARHVEEHHGGAWKIAFADFMTAMMALFLVLWLISSTSDKQKRALAQYFNPVKLVDMTTLKKGFHDPKETEMGSGRSTDPVLSEKGPADSRPKPVEPEADPIKGAIQGVKRPAPSRARPPERRDEKNRQAQAPKGQEGGEFALDVTRQAAPSPTDLASAFVDPFATVPDELRDLAEPEPDETRNQSLPLDHDDFGPNRSKVMNVIDSKSLERDARGKPVSTFPHPALVPGRQTEPAEASRPESSRRPARRAARFEPAEPQTKVPNSEPAPGDADLAALASEILDGAVSDSDSRTAPRLEVRATDEGVLISLTDARNDTMFAVGSAEPHRKTIEMMQRIARSLSRRPGTLIIRGHTDARPYRSGTSDNWRLSTARAHAARDVLVRGGLADGRIERVEGYADRSPKVAADPTAPENRRIEILLRKGRG